MANNISESEIKLNGLSLIKFHTKSCVPCKRIETILSKMEKEFPTITFYSVDIDDFIKLAQKYKIMSVPTLVMFSGDIEKGRIVGVVPTDNLRKAIKDFSK